MKIHRNLALAAIDTTRQIFFENRYADKAIEYVLKSNPKWGARDRAFIAETCYDLVRWWRLLWWASGQEPQNDTAALWRVLGVLLITKKLEMPNWTEFEGMDTATIKTKIAGLDQRALLQSVPDWLDALGEAELQGDWLAELAALNQQAPLVIRINTLKSNKKQIQDLFKQKEIATSEVPECPDALVLHKRLNLFALPEFKEGYFEVQDASSQLVAAFLAPQAGMRVIDACAGAGGKTLHIAALMQNKGRIISMDTEDWKLGELKKRARRAGIDTVETRTIEDAKTIKRLHDTADRLLLDVPCSGLGVLRRNPDAKWKLTPEAIAEVRQKQAAILQEYAKMLKKGGQMVYATCSILPSENSQQVQLFLQNNPDFSLIEERKISATSGFDGFYMAKMVFGR